MKQLSIEEKARRYDEALEKVRQLCAYPTTKPFIGDLQDLFPELKESEDEKIRKQIKAFIKSRGSQITQSKTDAWIVWLEKQGEHRQNTNYPKFNLDDVLALQCCMETVKKVQEDNYLYEQLEGLHGKIYDAYYFEKYGEKPQGESALEAINEEKVDNANKVEPKFKKGEWLCENEPNNYARFIQILEIVNVQGKERYRISRDIHNDGDIVELDFAEKYYHKFDIQDAKDGDVLRLGGVIAILKKYIGQEKCICYCSFCGEGNGFEIPIENGEDNVYGCTDTTPATKEQRDKLFQKMKEAGYEWDANKKQLVDDIEPILLTKEILEANGFYWGYTSSTEDFISNPPHDLPFMLPSKTWCYDEGDGEVTVEFPTEADGGVITADYNDRRVEMLFYEPIKVHEFQQFLRLCGGGLTELANNFKVK